MSSSEAVLKTLIVADNKQFTQTVTASKKQAADLSTAVTKDLNKSFEQVGKTARASMGNTRDELKLTRLAADKLKDKFKEVGKALLAAFAIEKIAETLQGVAEEIDTLGRTAEKLDLPATKLQEFEYAAKMVDGTIGDVEAGFKKLRTAIIEASTGNAEATKGFANLGLSAGQLAKMDIADAYEKVAASINKIKSATGQAGAANDIFGKKAGQEQLLLLRSLTESVDQYRSKGLGLKEGDFQAFEEFDQKMKESAATINDQLRKAFINLLPAINGVTSAIGFMSKDLLAAVDRLGSVGSMIGSAVNDAVGGNRYDPNASGALNQENSDGFFSTVRSKSNIMAARTSTILSNNAGTSLVPASGNSVTGATQVSSAAKAVADNFAAFSIALVASTKALNTFQKEGLAKILGTKSQSELGSSYLAGIIKPQEQVQSDDYDKLANELYNNIQNGEGTASGNLGLAQRLKSIAERNGTDYGPSNSGQLAGANELLKYLGAANDAVATDLNKVTVEIKVDKNGIITAFGTSSEGVSLMEAAARGMLSKEAQQTGF